MLAVVRRYMYSVPPGVTWQGCSELRVAVSSAHGNPAFTIVGHRPVNMTVEDTVRGTPGLLLGNASSQCWSSSVLSSVPASSTTGTALTNDSVVDGCQLCTRRLIRAQVPVENWYLQHLPAYQGFETPVVSTTSGCLQACVKQTVTAFNVQYNEEHTTPSR
jgi:hypothetical protein